MQGCRVLQKEEIKALLNEAPDQRTRMLILTGLFLGTRISESLKLKFGDFRGPTIRIKSLKGSNDRTLVLPDELRKEVELLELEYLDAHYDITDRTPVFFSQKDPSKPICRQRASLIIKQIKEAAGVDGKVAAHSFRKNFTTKIHELCQNNLVQTAKYTGHKNLNSLVSYIESTENTDLTKELAWI